MRLILALLGLTLATAASAPRDWTQVTATTPAGAYVTGNPAARVKLVEYASYTCSHCAAFSRESDAVLKGRFIRSGSTSLELRHLIRDRLDLAAAVAARCTGTKGFAATSSAIFAAQDDWLPRGATFEQANAARIGTYPMLAQLRAYADGAGITAIVKARGLTERQVAACYADQAGVDRILAMTNAVPATVTGTPTFFINGRQVASVATWDGLQTPLRAAGAK